jgi:tRNA splicing endonuclease
MSDDDERGSKLIVTAQSIAAHKQQWRLSKLIRIGRTAGSVDISMVSGNDIGFGAFLWLT